MDINRILSRSHPSKKKISSNVPINATYNEFLNFHSNVSDLILEFSSETNTFRDIISYLRKSRNIYLKEKKKNYFLQTTICERYH